MTYGSPVAVAGDAAAPQPRELSSAAAAPAASSSASLLQGRPATDSAMDVDDQLALPAVEPLLTPYRVPAALREHCIGENSHCNDNNSSERNSEKNLPHSCRLRVAYERNERTNGWLVVVVPLLVEMAGTRGYQYLAGTIFQPILHFLTDSMDFPPSEAPACLSRLHLHAIASCHSIIWDRNQLERVPNPNHSSPL